MLAVQIQRIVGNVDHVLTFVAASTPVSLSTNLRSSALTNSSTFTVVQSRPANRGSGCFAGGLSMRSCTAIDDTDGCLEERGDGGCPRSSLKLWRCWAAALGKEGIRSEELLLGGEAASMLEREDATGEGEEVIGGSRFGVVMLESLCTGRLLMWFGDGLRKFPADGRFVLVCRLERGKEVAPQLAAKMDCECIAGR